ncbi:MAG: TolC family protein [Planctomycetaceae bacterium]|jgi:outer membrane protein TolC|nr:TolC family protein [Planctomycetaceae bacterium]MBT6483309.1 TolC family protein [Planctomycetaceae bacterium]MBT6494636.1 TolC family protein [Planctomycetaceae bacterium]
MKDVISRITIVLAIASLALPGCISLSWQDRFHADGDTDHFKYVATQVEYADVDSSPTLEYTSVAAPRSIDADQPTEYWDVSLEEVVRHALDNSKVMRDLGGIVLRTPDQAPTTLDPSIQETDPQLGVAAALSAFDASFATNAFFEYNDRALNNTFFGGGTRNLKQDLAIMQTQIAKRAVTGTEFTLRNNTDYDANNSPGNAFPSVWNTNMEAEFRHPLLLGSGVDFNRVAGSSSVPGVNNGVLIARMNVDQSLSDFEIAVRDYVSNLENAYWDLYYAYRDLEAKIKARDSALKTWQVVKALENRRGGEAEKETQAREQYYRFKEEVENALNGKLVQGTQTNNGSRAGTFRGSLGVFVAERRLRLLMGLPINDQRLLRPGDEPPLAEVILDWDESLLESLTRRAELRKQKWTVKRRELELDTSRRYLLPTLDVVGRYRWRGFGKDLFRQHNLNAADVADTTRKRSEANNAFDSMVNGDFQEWQMGVELAFPFGQRQAHAGVRNAELRLARARMLLKEQERDVVFGLSNSVSEMKRAYVVVKTNFHRRDAAQQQVDAVQLAYENDNTTIDVLLEAQRRLATADSAYYRALSEYAISIKNVHYEKGSLLEFSEVQLSEGMWPVRAYWDAKKRHHLQSDPLKFLNPFLSARPVVSEGEFPQSVLPADDNGGFDNQLNDGGNWPQGEQPLVPVPSPATEEEASGVSTFRTIEPIGFQDDRSDEPIGFQDDRSDSSQSPFFRRSAEFRDADRDARQPSRNGSLADEVNPFRSSSELRRIEQP